MDHVPVLAGSAVEYLRIREDGIYVDCTAGAGGHSALIAERLSERGTLIALDRDPVAVKLTRERLKTNSSSWRYPIPINSRRHASSSFASRCLTAERLPLLLDIPSETGLSMNKVRGSLVLRPSLATGLPFRG